MKDVCKHCGASQGIHEYDTNRCPQGGFEQGVRRGVPSVYMTTVYEEDNVTPLAERVTALEKTVRALESQVQLLREIVQGIPRVKKTPVDGRVRGERGPWRKRGV